MALNGISLVKIKEGGIIESNFLDISNVLYFCVFFFQRVPLAPTRCPPGSRSVSPARPTVSQRRKGLWCVCVRRITSEPPWTHPLHHAQVIRLYMSIFVRFVLSNATFSFTSDCRTISLMHCIVSSRHFCIKYPNHYPTLPFSLSHICSCHLPLYP